MKKEKLNSRNPSLRARSAKQSLKGLLRPPRFARRPRNDIFGSLKFDRHGLLPAIIQDYKSREVLMLAYMNKESLQRTIKSGKTCFWSRSRKKYWTKGETSGCFQFVKQIAYDCDMDALLIKVRQAGNACHTGKRSCFYRKITR